MRILLTDPVSDGEVETAVYLLRGGGVRVGSGATIYCDGLPPQGAITLLENSQLQTALDLLAKHRIRATASD